MSDPTEHSNRDFEAESSVEMPSPIGEAPAEAPVETGAPEANAPAPEASAENEVADNSPVETAEPVKDQKTAAKKESFVSILFDYMEIVVLSICAVLVLFTLVGRLCQVNGNSMRNTLYNEEMLITTSLDTPKAGDIVVFHQTSTDSVGRQLNEPLVKRIIATEGQTVRIDYAAGEVSVDGKVLDESAYVSLLHPSTGRELGIWIQYPDHHFDQRTGIFEATVPDGHYFVMGDNRNNSADSRSNEVGFVDARRILGKVVLRVRPFTVFD